MFLAAAARRLRACIVLMASFAAAQAWVVPARAAMGISSPDLADGRLAPAQAWNGDGCTGGNLSPALSWWGAPAGTRSFAVGMIDLDAPGRKGFWHWLAFDIPASVLSLPADAGAASGAHLPRGGIQAANDYGARGYGGPCPPPGETHRYLITVYALNRDTLDINPEQPAGTLASLVLSHALGKASLSLHAGRIDTPPAPVAGPAPAKAESGKPEAAKPK